MADRVIVLGGGVGGMSAAHELGRAPKQLVTVREGHVHASPLVSATAPLAERVTELRR